MLQLASQNAFRVHIRDLFYFLVGRTEKHVSAITQRRLALRFWAFLSLHLASGHTRDHNSSTSLLQAPLHEDLIKISNLSVQANSNPLATVTQSVQINTRRRKGRGRGKADDSKCSRIQMLTCLIDMYRVLLPSNPTLTFLNMPLTLGRIQS